MFNKLAVAAFVSLACVHALGADFSIIRQYVVPLISAMPTVHKGELDPNKIRAAGSGVIVAPGFILTANHVLPHRGMEIFAESPTGIIKLGTVVASDPVRELGLIKADVSCPCAPIAKTELPIDSDVYTVGYPMWSMYAMQFVTVGHAQGPYGIYNVMTANTISGGSGGGTFGKEDGVYKLGGITSSIAAIAIGPRELTVQQDLTWISNSISIGVVKRFLDKNNVPYK